MDSLQPGLALLFTQRLRCLAANLHNWNHSFSSRRVLLPDNNSLKIMDIKILFWGHFNFTEI